VKALSLSGCLGGALLALAACGGGAAVDQSRTDGAPAAAAASGQPGEVRLLEVPPQRLKSGQCALALWSRAAKPERVMMAFSDPAVARVRFAERTEDLPQTGREGRQVFGHYPLQSYANEKVTLTVRVDFEPRDQLIGGAIARNGTIEIVSVSGWSATVPVGGIVACEP